MQNLSKDIIKDFLPENLKDMPVFTYDEIDSTNSECKRKSGIPLPFVVTANGQTSGRGRHGKSFYSPKETGIYLSLAVKSEDTPQLVTLYSAVAVTKAINEICLLYPQIKWVNDLYLNGKKICGILCENSNGNIIIGIGINLNTSAFPEEIENIAGSLNCNPDIRHALIAKIIENLLKKEEDFLSFYRQNSLLTGKKITFIKDNTEFSATACDIDNSGNLLVTLPDGRHLSLNSGEITLKKPLIH